MHADSSSFEVSFVCRKCEKPSQARFEFGTAELECSRCGQAYTSVAGGEPGSEPPRCFVCGCEELFARKDFSQRLGLTIVVLGVVLSSIAWATHHIMWTYAILFATAMIDVVLYVVVGNVLQCYRCSAVYRGLAECEEHATFSLETHERYRQQEARL